MTNKNIDKSAIRCPVELTMSLITNKWKVLIVRDLLHGRLRFTQLKHSLSGISQKVLTANLRELEHDGLLKREVYAEVPPRVEYELTDLGQSLREVIDVMIKWGSNYQKEQFGTGDEELARRLIFGEGAGAEAATAPAV